MKKSALFIAIIISVVIVGGALYRYAQNQPEAVLPLQQVALDNPGIKNFDDVCTKKDETELECTGNIEQFDCERYRGASAFADLKPLYPMLTCGKKSNYEKGEGVYQVQGVGWSLGTTITDYIIIKDSSFQLIQSEDQFRQQFQPITSVAEATDYFQALHKAVLILNEQQLSTIKSPQDIGGDVKGTFHISLESINLSEVIKTWRGYTIIAYSGFGGGCVDEIYQYKYLLKENGQLIEKDKKLIWEVANKPACIY